jgi:hypothetical protein
MNQFAQYSEEHGVQSVSTNSGRPYPANSDAAYQLSWEDQDCSRSLDDSFILANVESPLVLSSDRTSLEPLSNRNMKFWGECSR